MHFVLVAFQTTVNDDSHNVLQLYYNPSSRMYSYNILLKIKQRLSIFMINSIINLSTSSLSKGIFVHVAHSNVEVTGTSVYTLSVNWTTAMLCWQE